MCRWTVLASRNRPQDTYTEALLCEIYGMSEPHASRGIAMLRWSDADCQMGTQTRGRTLTYLVVYRVGEMVAFGLKLRKSDAPPPVTVFCRDWS